MEAKSDWNGRQTHGDGDVTIYDRSSQTRLELPFPHKVTTQWHSHVSSHTSSSIKVVSWVFFFLFFFWESPAKLNLSLGLFIRGSGLWGSTDVQLHCAFNLQPSWTFPSSQRNRVPLWAFISTQICQRKISSIIYRLLQCVIHIWIYDIHCLHHAQLSSSSILNTAEGIKDQKWNFHFF